MEQFTLLTGDQTLKSSREPLNNSLLTLRSLCAGTAFPTTNLSVGMLCYRTDLGRIYQLSDAENQTWTDKVAMNISGSAAVAGQVAWANVLARPSTYPPAAHTHLYAGSASAGGSATSANKLTTARTINDVPFDGTADITLDIGVQSVNGNTPDADGSVYLNAIYDATIDGQNLTFTFANGNSKTLTTQDTIGSNWTLTQGDSGWTRDKTTGLTIQWSYGTASRTWTFPRPFTAVYYAASSSVSTGKSSSGLDYVNNVSTTGMTNLGFGSDSYLIAIGIS